METTIIIASVCFVAGLVVGDKYQPIEKVLSIAKSWMSK